MKKQDIMHFFFEQFLDCSKKLEMTDISCGGLRNYKSI